MTKPFRKIVYWGSGLTVYVLMISAVFSLLLDLDVSQVFIFGKDPAVVSGEYESVPLLLNTLDQSSDFTGVLLPLGPGDSRLPGLPAIWDEFRRAGDVDKARPDVDGFDGIQAVKNAADLSRGAVSEIFLSGSARQVFRRGPLLFVWKREGTVQILDCENPREPKLSGSLPYSHIRHMEMVGDVAYLLLDRPEARSGAIVVVDLGTPGEPRELAQLSVPKETKSFFLMGRQLVVYQNARVFTGDHFIHLYDLTDDFQLTPRGTVANSLLGSGFLKYEDYLLVPGLYGGLYVCDFSNPLEPVIVAALDSPQLRSFARYGDTVFATGPRNCIYAFDLHDPLNPVMSAVVEEANHFVYPLAFGRYSYYFTMNGYLQVFAAPLRLFPKREELAAGLTGELVVLQSGKAFTLLGDTQDPLPPAVVDSHALPDKLKIVDSLVWQRFLVVLDDDGQLHFFRMDGDSSLVFQQSLPLSAPQRWLTATNDRLYVGGAKTVSVVANEGDNVFAVSGQVDLSGKESWDGLVIQKTLCLAAGKDGLLSFSLQQPDRPVASPGWTIPRHLEPQVDVRQLASPGNNRILFTAGDAGLFGGRIKGGGQFQLESIFNFLSQVHALTVIDGFCLVSTGTDVCVIDISNENSFQNLGEIVFPGVERFAVAPPGFWAGYSRQQGWLPLPSPRLVLPGEFGDLPVAGSPSLPGPDRYGYRLNLFNDHAIKTIPGILRFSSQQGRPSAGGELGVH